MSVNNSTKQTVIMYSLLPKMQLTCTIYLTTAVGLITIGLQWELSKPCTWFTGQGRRIIILLILNRYRIFRHECLDIFPLKCLPWDQETDLILTYCKLFIARKLNSLSCRQQQFYNAKFNDYSIICCYSSKQFYYALNTIIKLQMNMNVRT